MPFTCSARGGGVGKGCAGKAAGCCWQFKRLPLLSYFLLLLLVPSSKSLKSFCVNKQKQSPIGGNVAAAAVVVAAVISLATANADASRRCPRRAFYGRFFLFIDNNYSGVYVLCASSAEKI